MSWFLGWKFHNLLRVYTKWHENKEPTDYINSNNHSSQFKWAEKDLRIQNTTNPDNKQMITSFLPAKNGNLGLQDHHNWTDWKTDNILIPVPTSRRQSQTAATTAWIHELNRSGWWGWCVGVGNVFSTHTGPLGTSRVSYECQEYCCWSYVGLYGQFTPILAV